MQMRWIAGMSLKRGDDNALDLGPLGTFDMEMVLDRPLLTFSSGAAPQAAGLIKPNPEHPLRQLVTSLLINALVLFPACRRNRSRAATSGP